MTNSDLSDRIRVYLTDVDNSEKALNAADALVDELRQKYMQYESVQKIVDAQKKTFAVLNELGSKGYDMISQYEAVCAIIQNNIK